MNDFSNMLSNAKKMQERMKEVQESIKKIEVEGTSGGNLVKVILGGDYEIADVAACVDWLRREAKIEHILLWGRSAGAVACVRRLHPCGHRFHANCIRTCPAACGTRHTNSWGTRSTTPF